MNVIFLGTPDFAVPSLKKLIESKHNILAVVTNPDKKVGREQKVVFSPVKQCAIENSLPILQFTKIRLEGAEVLRNLQPDLMISCAYGQILSQEIIDIAPHGIINVHGSLLPKYRGAAPIQQAVLDGEKETGVTIMQTEAGIDTGDILSVAKTPIGETETAGELFDRLSVLGADLLIETIDKIDRGLISPIKQDDSLATHVSMIKKEDGVIDFSKPPVEVFNHVRGMNPWPCAFTGLNGKMLKVFCCKPFEDLTINEGFGLVLSADIENGLKVACKGGYILVEELQLEGGKRMPTRDFLLGRKISVGDLLKW